MTAGIILEGVTGAGKTQTLAALQAHPAFPSLLLQGHIFTEEETLGEFMDELKDQRMQPSQRNIRMYRVFNELQQAVSASPHHYGYLLERFHPSYYALVPQWHFYESVDRQLQALRCTIILLSFHPDHHE